MSTTKKPMRVRAISVAGGITILGVTGAGLAGSAGAATAGSASSTLAKIKYCESGGNYQAVNSSSGASGAYQFLNSTWQGLSAAKGYSSAASAPASVQDAAALELYSQAGTSPWAASSSCWSSLTSAPASSSTASTSSSTAPATSTTSTTSTAQATTTATTSHATTAAKSTSKPKPAVGQPQQAGHHGAPAHHGADHKKKPAKNAHRHQSMQKLPAPVKHTGKHHAKPAAPKPMNKPANTFAHAA